MKFANGERNYAFAVRRTNFASRDFFETNFYYAKLVIICQLPLGRNFEQACGVRRLDVKTV